MRKSDGFLLIFLLMASSLIICGCETTKSVAAMGKGVAQDIAKNSAAAWQGVKHADAWVRENVW
jgi:predicted small secreted protein